MKQIILFYSRTGNSRRIATRIGKELGVEVHEIRDNRKYSGIFGFLIGGFFASQWKKTDYEIPSLKEIEEDVHFIFVSPIWAGHAPPAVYSFLSDHEIKYKSLVFINDGSDPNKALDAMVKRYGSFINFYNITKSLKNEESVMNVIIKNGFGNELR